VAAAAMALLSFAITRAPAGTRAAP
jgi:hypothetical protein